MNMGTPTPTPEKPWEYMVHVTMTDGSQTFEILDTKDDANMFLSDIIADPDVAEWVCYQTVKRGTK